MDLEEQMIKVKRDFMMHNSKMDKFMELLDQLMMKEFILLEIKLMEIMKENK